MNFIKDILEKQKAIILDGALGTFMQIKGYDVNDSLWSAKFLDENPDVIANIHKEYLEVGSDCIITSSYQASVEGFLKKGFSEKRAEELLRLSIKIAKRARDEFWENLENKDNRIKPLVAASIGPYGAFLADGSEYSGDYKISDDELINFHKNRLDIILDEKPDLIACETMPSFKEVKTLCELLKEYPKTSNWITFSAKNDSFTNAGDDIISSMKYLENQNHIDAIGINCTAPQYISSLIEKIKSVSNKPIVVYPNGGSKYNPITKKWEKGEVSATEFAKMAYLWYKNGASIIGGCCETEAKEIKLIREYILN